jgi:hypothetical protein
MFVPELAMWQVNHLGVLGRNTVSEWWPLAIKQFGFVIERRGTIARLPDTLEVRNDDVSHK